ncbi:type II toxin-antitoxin system RelE family toxin [Maribellus mangrovi]|uniref:type II toxin-antitoxin system RelE family toxin n=1 Tax=Maribellus mangrovi TaxID=3133146 RepID=UPI0030EDD13A
MRISFLSGFEKDLARSKDKTLAKVVFQCIQQFEKANSLDELPNIKKLKGHTTAYRYRKGKYRIGFFFENDTIIFAAFAPRSKIYSKFP